VTPNCAGTASTRGNDVILRDAGMMDGFEPRGSRALRAPFCAVLSIALVALGCDQSRRFEVSADTGIEIAKFEDRNWNPHASKPLFRFESGSYADGWRGFHLDADGLLWQYEYGRKPAPGQCDVAGLSDSPDARDRCLYENSVLLGRLTAAELKEVVRQAPLVRDVGRLRGGGQKTDYAGGPWLELSGYATGSGQPLRLARCYPREQLVSAEARSFVALFHRLGRVFPRFALTRQACGAGRLGTDIAPGVLGWWVPPTAP